MIKKADLSNTEGDPLLSSVRKKLRQDYGFARNLKRRFSIPAVFSTEKPLYPQDDGCVSKEKPQDSNLKLDCFSGYGTATFVTGTFAFIMAEHVVRRITEKNLKDNSHEWTMAKTDITNCRYTLPYPTL